MKNKKVIIIGGGSSALAAAYFLKESHKVEIYEKEKSIGQKFLVAGKGGFNLTNSLIGNDLLEKYTPHHFLDNSINNFDSLSTRRWLKELEIETFTGTSGRVFANKNHKPIDVLTSIKQKLILSDVKIFTRHKFVGFGQKGKILIESHSGINNVEADYIIFALGGSSWSITGSDGKWLNLFEQIGIKTNPFQASNCGININWPQNILKYHVGKPLKNINVSINNNNLTGEAVITNNGLEGNSIYSAIPNVRECISNKEKCDIFIDFKPNNSSASLQSKINNKIGSADYYKKIFNLNSTHLALIKSQISKDDFLNPIKFLNNLKKLRLKITSLRPIDEAISTVGGIDISEINYDFSLKKMNNIFVIGEMVDWDAPTGGFLLQGCFSMGHSVAKSISNKIK